LHQRVEGCSVALAVDAADGEDQLLGTFAEPLAQSVEDVCKQVVVQIREENPDGILGFAG